MRSHGTEDLRGSDRVPLSSISSGRFGRMFRRLKPAPAYAAEVLMDLAEQMRDTDPPAGGWGGTPQTGDNPRIPAGYTYLGQFIDHDVTFDPVSSLQRQNDPDALHNFRTPKFDLDSLYGSGPADEPFQYVRGSGGMRMLVEPNRNGEIDLPRNSEDVALIGDPRNDENTIVGQLQLVFLKFHNAVAPTVEADASIAPDGRFKEAQRRVRWHYQWVVVNDYLRRLVGDAVIDALFFIDPTSNLPDIKRRFYRPKNNAYMPIEFSAAAFRFGHSMIRGIYDLSSAVTERPIFIPGPLPNEFADLRGFRRLPSAWTVDWSLFFSIAGSTPQLSRRIDAKLVPALFDLPDDGGSLAFRNLLRGQVLNLPSGQDVAKHLGAEVLTGDDLGAPDPTPLWFYILKESELRTGGEHLGPVGARIVAEVLLGMLEADPESYISVDPGWRPTLPDADGDGNFSMADIVAFSQAGP